MVIIVLVFGVSRCVLFVVTTRLGEDLEPSKERIGIKAIDEIVKCAVLKEKSVVTPMKNQLLVMDSIVCLLALSLVRQDLGILIIPKRENSDFITLGKGKQQLKQPQFHTPE
jgi:hypothetical protein